MSAPPVLEITGLTKTFPGTVALDKISFEIADGEIHALVGQNGSGKSTLIKVLAGYHRPDPGSTIRLCGEPLTHDAIADHHRLRFVHQDLGLFLELSAVDNLALRSEYLTAAGRIDWRGQVDLTWQLLSDFGVDLDLRRPLSSATPIQRTIVAIAAALAGWEGGPGVLVLDEPTAVLPQAEANHLLEVVHRVRDRGTSVLYVSHRLDEVLTVADRVTVLRDGAVMATRPTAGLHPDSLATLMAGDDVDAGYRAHLPVADGRPAALTVNDLSGRYLSGVSLTLRRGEVLGIAGLPGSGATELAHILAGVDRPAGGEITLAGSPAVPAAKAPNLGLPIVPSDRLHDAVIPGMTVAENISLSVLDRLQRGPALMHAQERRLVGRWLTGLGIKTAGSTAQVTTLSGGNQQKVIIARCLARDPSVLILCDPTAGVDPAARQAIYEQLAERTRSGLALLVTSADLGDLLALCTRVLVLGNGRIVGELSGAEITEQRLIRAMEETEQQ